MKTRAIFLLMILLVPSMSQGQDGAPFPTLTREESNELKQLYPLRGGVTTVRDYNPRPGDKLVLGGFEGLVPVASNFFSFLSLDKAVDAGDSVGISNLMAAGKVRLVQVNTPVLIIKDYYGPQAAEVRITGGYMKGRAVFVLQSSLYGVVTKEEIDHQREARAETERQRAEMERQKEENRKEREQQKEEYRKMTERQNEEERKAQLILAENRSLAMEYKAEWKKIKKAALGMGTDHAARFKRDAPPRILSRILKRHPGLTEDRLKAAIREN